MTFEYITDTRFAVEQADTDKVVTYFIPLWKLLKEEFDYDRMVDRKEDRNIFPESFALQPYYNFGESRDEVISPWISSRLQLEARHHSRREN